jgi:hypothetical protein
MPSAANAAGCSRVASHRHIREIPVKPAPAAQAVPHPLFRCGSKASVCRLQIHLARLRLVEERGHPQDCGAQLARPAGEASLGKRHFHRVLKGDLPRSPLPSACPPGRKNPPREAFPGPKSRGHRFRAQANERDRGWEPVQRETSASISGLGGGRGADRHHPAASSAKPKGCGAGQHRGLCRPF